MIKIYNTLSQEKELFQPIEEKKVSMYVCGPTVYNYIHIGNARSTVAFDTVRRYLIYAGYDVNYVSNFTDVDDKIIKAANEQGMSPKELADKYIEAFYQDTDNLNVLRASRNPRVIENMADIIVFIEELITKGYAYESHGDVYYRTAAFKDYGKLSKQSLDDLMVGASDRIDDEELSRKEAATDFALWKQAKEGEVSWQSPWGPGRPGWHIECSVMATKYLGDTIDIHAGGHDLIFPHHENEIAQSEAKTGQTFANYWMHNGFVTMGDDGEKMSKSLGNFVVAHDLLKKVDPQVVRFFLATAHYRSPIKFTEDNITLAENNLERIKTTYNNLDYRLKDAKDYLESDKEDLASFDIFDKDFNDAMSDDFNAQNGIAVVYAFLKALNIYLEKAELSKAVLEALKEKLEGYLWVFGIQLKEEILDEDIQNLIDERQAAREAKSFQRSDEIRDYLKDQGIILDDTPQGTRWKRA